ncbi:hypothetical protein DUNSADRAFT_1258 [Dunaliella salina]|uniref:Encoded protein n=1 Tax=Dunaliella salina TaxID=3046 RepID=A0ABQ7GX91_DUNSA|nr:hypothetical protein DUNSADRAFT_1258 [Dunaliella salina]|eukprot:KAF5839226.1 hypothetical protein DUNSADRAFT_1258 [Dunaliella salina]
MLAYSQTCKLKQTIHAHVRYLYSTGSGMQTPQIATVDCAFSLSLFSPSFQSSWPPSQPSSVPLPPFLTSFSS